MATETKNWNDRMEALTTPVINCEERNGVCHPCTESDKAALVATCGRLSFLISEQDEIMENVSREGYWLGISDAQSTTDAQSTLTEEQKDVRDGIGPWATSLPDNHMVSLLQAYADLFGAERIEDYEGVYQRHPNLWGCVFHERTRDAVKKFLDSNYPNVRYVVTIVTGTQYGTPMFRIHCSGKMKPILRAYSDAFDAGLWAGRYESK